MCIKIGEIYFNLSVLLFSFAAEIHQVLTFALSSETLKFVNSRLMVEIHQQSKSFDFLLILYTIIEKIGVENIIKINEIFVHIYHENPT
nr:MAG TPA: hypothetical protein [Caudoviricetes sp.]